MLLVVAALGLFRLPDALARQHAATKATTLALGLLLAGVGLVGGTPAWWWRAAVIVVLLVVTVPVASHMLARAAAREGRPRRTSRSRRSRRRARKRRPWSVTPHRGVT